jgi:release factor glutamine methyltransferase
MQVKHGSIHVANNKPHMKIAQWLNHTQQHLESVGITTARLDCLVLLEDILDINRAQILARPEYTLSHAQIVQLNALIARRTSHEPLAYIRHRSEFYGQTFYIDQRVLQPRTESEMIIDLLKILSFRSHSTIIDIGTGCGALALTAKREFPAATVIGTDIDPDCLDVASYNIKASGMELQLLESDLLTTIPIAILRGAILLCNLPYVPDGFLINTAATHEPRHAIFGGPDGLDYYRKLFDQIRSRAVKPQFVLTEALPTTHHILKTIAEEAGLLFDRAQDFVQIFRTDTTDPA